LLAIYARQREEYSKISHQHNPNGNSGKQTATGEKVWSFAGLMEELSKACRLVVIPKIKTDASPEVVMVKKISPTQKQAFKLLNIKLL